MSSKVSRRVVLGAIGSGVAAAQLMSADANARAVAPEALPNGTLPPEALVASIAPGAHLAGCSVIAIEPLTRGAIGVLLSGPSGPFRLEVMLRDPSPVAAKAPGRTERFAVFVANAGDGASPTVEVQGLAAMALAFRIADIEDRIDATALLTHATRITQHREKLLSAPDARGVPDTRG